MHILKKLPAVLALLGASSTAAWAAPCATAGDIAAFRTAAVQQQLMVAALTCKSVETYNRFVIAYRPELEKSDADLKAYFIRGGSEADYDSFKTKLANLSSLSTISDRAGYCANAATAFEMALKSRQALSSFVTDQRLMIAMPKQTLCAAPVIEAAVAPRPKALAAPAPKLMVARAEAPMPPLAKAEPPRPVQLAAAEPADVMVEGVPAYERPSASPYGGNRARPVPQPARTYEYRDAEDGDVAPERPRADPYGGGRAQPQTVRTYEYRDSEDYGDLPPRPERPRMLQASREGYYGDRTYRERYAAPNWWPRDYYGRPREY